MTLLRCSAQLLRRFAPVVPTGESPDSAPGRLGDWYARIVATRPRHLVLCTNEHTLLSVVVPLVPRDRLLDRFVAAAQHRIDQIDAPASIRMRERSALVGVRVGRCTNRSVIGTMNQFAYAVEAWLYDHSSQDLETLGLWLCDTPCSALRTDWPWLEAQVLLAENEHRGAPGTKASWYM